MKKTLLITDRRAAVVDIQCFLFGEVDCFL